MGDSKKLKVWQKSYELVQAVYNATAKFPEDERFGLTSQLRRSAASIPANLAEGCGRRTDRELDRYVRISLGSATELEYHLILARDVGCLTAARYEPLAALTSEVQNMLVALRKPLRRIPRALAHSS